MPSGNAIYTYTGKEPSVTIQGHTWLKGESCHLMDNGVIAVCEASDDFERADSDNPPGKLPAKPKGKAK